MDDQNHGAGAPAQTHSVSADRGMGVFGGRFREPLVFLLCCALILVFCFPTIISGSKNAGYLYTGDITGFYLPMVMKVHSLVHHLHGTALDYSIYNGSSDFFLSPNFFTFHPIVILYSLIAPLRADTPHHIGQLINIMVVLHAIVGLYFTQRLFNRVLGLELAASMFGGLLFAVSTHMVDALGQPPFFFAATVFPWILCAVLEAIERPSPTGILFASAPVVLTLVSGYIPLSLAGLEFSFLTVVVYLTYTQVSRKLPTGPALGRALVAAAPFAIGVVVCSLYIVALFLFAKETNSNEATNLFYSAHQLAETPVDLLRAFSVYLRIPGPTIEFSVAVGLVPITIALVFIFSSRSILTLRPHELFTLMGAGAAFIVSVMAIFGSYHVASDLLFYFAPVVGRMHIYQRFLIFSDLGLAAAITLMLVAVVRLKPSLTPRIVFGVLCVLVCAACVVEGFFGNAVGDPNGRQAAIILELLSAAIVAAALLVPNNSFIYLTAAALAVMPAVERMYERSPDTIFETQAARMPLQLKPAEDAALVDYIKKRTSKIYVKYADLTPMWDPKGALESFQKVFPYLVENQINLSSYSGFTFYLSERLQYRQRMPIDGEIRMRPDWTTLLATGADFLVVDAHEAQTTALGGLVSVADAYPLPGGFIMAPLLRRYPGNLPPLYDNGMIRLTPALPAAATLPNLALGSTASEFPVSSPASLAVDGHHDGDFKLGSVAHTGQDPNAWIELDLGKSQTIGDVRLWNRTDCCNGRLDNAWVFVSESPFADTDTAAVLKQRPGVSAHQVLASERIDVDFGSVTGRYVRVQLPGGPNTENAFLHLAEIEVYPPPPPVPAAAAQDTAPVREFSANYADRVKVKVDLKAPTQFVYEFSDNPRLTYRVDGKKVKFETASGAPTYVLPPGRHTVEIVYRNPPLLGFWIMFGGYWIVVLAVLLAELGVRAGLLPRSWFTALERKGLALLPPALRPRGAAAPAE